MPSSSEATDPSINAPAATDPSINAPSCTTMSEDFQHAKYFGQQAATDGGGRPVRCQKPSTQMNLNTTAFIQDQHLDFILSLLDGEEIENVFCFLTEQMSAKAGLRWFGQHGVDALVQELDQLLYRKVMEVRRSNDLTPAQKKAAIKYLMFLKENWTDFVLSQAYPFEVWGLFPNTKRAFQ